MKPSLLASRWPNNRSSWAGGALFGEQRAILLAIELAVMIGVAGDERGLAFSVGQRVALNQAEKHRLAVWRQHDPSGPPAVGEHDHEDVEALPIDPGERQRLQRWGAERRHTCSRLHGPLSSQWFIAPSPFFRSGDAPRLGLELGLGHEPEASLAPSEVNTDV